MLKSKTLKFLFWIVFFSFIVVACTPIKTSPKDEKHQMELTLHEVQVNIDDMRHELNSYKTDVEIVEGKIKNQENQLETMKQRQISQTFTRLDVLSDRIKEAELKIAQIDRKQKVGIEDIEKLSIYAKEMNLALSQYRKKITELENDVIAQGKRLEEVKKFKNTLDAVASSLKIKNEGYIQYKVRPGDSLEKIAKSNNTTVDILKKANDLDHDLIVIGQELKIPK